jgi:hypothetical protein
VLGEVGLLVAAVAVLGFLSRRRERDGRLLFLAGATFLLASVALAIGWVLSPIEIVRLTGSFATAGGARRRF